MANFSSGDDREFVLDCFSLFTKMKLPLRHNLTNSIKLHYQIVAYLNLCLFPPASLLNLSLIIVFITSKLYKTLSNIPLMFLASWDLMVSLFSQPLFAAYLLEVAKKKAKCGLFIAVIYIGPTCSLISSMIVLVVTTERYLALFYPYFWQAKVTRRTILTPLCMIWVPALLFTMFMFDLGKGAVGAVVFAMFTVLTLIWISFCYIKIYKHIRKMQTCAVGDAIIARSDEQAMKRRQARLSRYSSVIVTVFLVINIPYSFISMIIHSGPKEAGSFTAALEWYNNTFLLLASLVNPIVYAWQSPQIGRGILKLWHLRKVQSNPSNSSSLGDRKSFQTAKSSKDTYC